MASRQRRGAEHGAGTEGGCITGIGGVGARPSSLLFSCAAEALRAALTLASLFPLQKPRSALPRTEELCLFLAFTQRRDAGAWRGRSHASCSRPAGKGGGGTLLYEETGRSWSAGCVCATASPLPPAAEEAEQTTLVTTNSTRTRTGTSALN